MVNATPKIYSVSELNNYGAEDVRVSYYKYTAIDGSDTYMILCANIDKEPLKNVTISLQNELSSLQDALTGEKLNSFDMDTYGYRILFARGK